MNACIIDIESDNLYPEQRFTWTICLRRLNGETLTLNPFRTSNTKKQILDFIGKDATIIGHNFLGFDCWVLWKDFKMTVHVGKDTLCGQPVTYFDTLFASQFLYPDREGGHSLESWGERLGFPKIKYRQVALELGIIQPHENEFCRWSQKMDEYCLQDTLVTQKVFEELHPKIEAMNAFKLGQKNFFLMNAQAFTGFKFDIERAKVLKTRIEGMISDLKAEVEPNLPKRKLKKSEESLYTVPSKPYLKNGEFSATMENFIQRHNAKVVSSSLIEINGKQHLVLPGEQIVDGLPMTLSDQKELKEYFLSIGWEPSMWNVKKDAHGKPVKENRQIVRTSPKIQENGKICENLLHLDGELPKNIVKFLSMRNRHSVLSGWLEDKRLQRDGRLSAGATGIAACFTADTTILTNDGLKTWFQINKGDLVVTHKNNLKPVTDVFVNGLKEVFEVILENGIKTKLTANHPLYTDRGEFVKVEDIRIGDAVMAYPHKEVWSQWKDTELMVSSWGRVKNLWNNNYSTPRKSKERGSTILVDIRLKSGWRGTKILGRLVLETFKGLKEGNHCLHLNDLAFDNNIENLIEGDDKLNGEHRAKYGASAKSARERENCKLDWGKVEYIRTCSLTNIEISKKFNLSAATVSLIRNYKRWEKREAEYTQKKLSLVPVKVASIVSIGKQMTYGISVQDDESHLTDGIMTHNTHRQKHTIVVNVPKAQDDVLLGKEFRSLFTVDDGNVLIGVDQAALEARCEAHWIYPFDPDMAKELVSGDVHSRNTKAFFQKETAQFNIHSHDFNKDDPSFKPYRSKSKNGKFAVTYGCSAPKLAKTLGKPEKDGEALFDNFWRVNKGLKTLKDKVEHEWEKKGDKKWITGIDGRRLYSRSKHSLVNLLFQSTGAIIVDYALCLFDMKMGDLMLDWRGCPFYLYKGRIVKRVQYFHDEFGVEAEPDVVDEVAGIMEWCMVEAGRKLNLNVPLAAESKQGRNWAETH
jgi:hypothetical protein